MILGPGRRRIIVAAASVVLVIGVSGCTANGSPPPGSTASPASPPASAPSSPSPSIPSPPTPDASATPTPVQSPSPSTPGPAKVTQRNPGWALDRVDQRQLPLDKRFTTTGQGQGVTVYVVDGLFDVSNAEFGGRASVGLDLGEACVTESGINHGLFVAGLVAGKRTGVAKQAKIVLVGSSYGCEGAEGASDKKAIARIVRALDWVAKNAQAPAVVNLSLNGDAPAPTIAAAVERLVDAGLTVVASAGNDGENACRHPPAGLPSVITVGASTKADKDAGLNFGRCVDLFAPAEGVTSVVDPDLVPEGVVAADGAATSWAAPLASGAAALYLSVHPEASPEEVRDWLIDKATRNVLRGKLRGSPNRLLFTGGPV